MDNKTILAITLSLMVLIGWSVLFKPDPVTQKQVAQQEVKEQAATEKSPEVEDLIPPVYKEVPAAAPAPVLQPLLSEKEITVEAGLFTAVFTTKGGTAKSWEINEKKYWDNGSPVQLVPDKPAIPPLSILLDGEQSDLPQKVSYTVSPDTDSIILHDNKMSDTLTFTYSAPSGFTIRKTFTFYKDSYKVGFSTEVIGVKSYLVALGSEFGVANQEGAWVHIGPTLLKDTDNKVEFEMGNIEDAGLSTRFFRWVSGEKGKSQVLHEGNIQWIAQEDQYFATALVPVTQLNESRVWEANDGQDMEIAYRINSQKQDFMIFAGPKLYSTLETYEVGLEHIIDYGMLTIIAKPLFWLLKVFYNALGNYGWAIVVLTIVVRIPFIPLLNKSQQSMKKMQKVQPMMAEIKEKYKKDPQKMQKETMALYKKHKVNPVGGCLPMLIQMPVFFALYKILLTTVELKGAPFALWITDLSLKDPYYILPVVMGATMLIQQKMTPSAMDPKQAKMMLMMPIVFTFMFLQFSAGLVLYWLVNNTLGIIQQYFVNKKA
ncbi:MAG: membrane protein insertase YidC [Nitrospirota bacterium]